MKSFEDLMPEENEKKKPKTSKFNFDEVMFGLAEPTNEEITSCHDGKKLEKIITEIEADNLLDFENHPFRLYEKDRLNDLAESIKESGIITPLVVRAKGADYEIISGHNRKRAAVEAGLKVLPCIILKEMSDDEALKLVIESNKQRSFSELSYSERAHILTLEYELFKRQGKRTDLIDSIDKEQELIKSVNEALKENFGLSPRTIARYLRIHKLVEGLKKFLDDGKLTFVPAVEISFLETETQKGLKEVLAKRKIKIDLKKARLLREEESKQGVLSEETILGLLIKKKKEVKKITLDASVKERFFKDIEGKEVEGIIIKALEYYFDQKN